MPAVALRIFAGCGPAPNAAPSAIGQIGSPLATPLRLNTVPVFPGGTVDIIVQGTNPGNWHLHDHSDLATTNNGQFPGGMMTMLMYEDAEKEGVKFKDVIQVSS